MRLHWAARLLEPFRWINAFPVDDPASLLMAITVVRRRAHELWEAKKPVHALALRYLAWGYSAQAVAVVLDNSGVTCARSLVARDFLVAPYLPSADGSQPVLTSSMTRQRFRTSQLPPSLRAALPMAELVITADSTLGQLARADGQAPADGHLDLCAAWFTCVTKGMMHVSARSLLLFSNPLLKDQSSEVTRNSVYSDASEAVRLPVVLSRCAVAAISAAGQRVQHKRASDDGAAARDGDALPANANVGDRQLLHRSMRRWLRENWFTGTDADEKLGEGTTQHGAARPAPQRALNFLDDATKRDPLCQALDAAWRERQDFKRSGRDVAGDVGRFVISPVLSLPDALALLHNNEVLIAVLAVPPNLDSVLPRQKGQDVRLVWADDAFVASGVTRVRMAPIDVCSAASGAPQTLVMSLRTHRARESWFLKDGNVSADRFDSVAAAAEAVAAASAAAAAHGHVPPLVVPPEAAHLGVSEIGYDGWYGSLLLQPPKSDAEWLTFTQHVRLFRLFLHTSTPAAPRRPRRAAADEVAASSSDDDGAAAAEGDATVITTTSTPLTMYPRLQRTLEAAFWAEDPRPYTRYGRVQGLARQIASSASGPGGADLFAAFAAAIPLLMPPGETWPPSRGSADEWDRRAWRDAAWAAMERDDVANAIAASSVEDDDDDDATNAPWNARGPDAIAVASFRALSSGPGAAGGHGDDTWQIDRVWALVDAVRSDGRRRLTGPLPPGVETPEVAVALWALAQFGPRRHAARFATLLRREPRFGRVLWNVLQVVPGPLVSGGSARLHALRSQPPAPGHPASTSRGDDNAHCPLALRVVPTDVGRHNGAAALSLVNCPRVSLGHSLARCKYLLLPEVHFTRCEAGAAGDAPPPSRQRSVSGPGAQRPSVPPAPDQLCVLTKAGMWDLRARARQPGYNERVARRDAWCILQGLKTLHDHQIAHLDVKPANLVWVPAARVPDFSWPPTTPSEWEAATNTHVSEWSDGHVALTDFCEASFIEHEGQRSLGTPRYAPPERRGTTGFFPRRTDHALPAVDVYSFGVTFVELVLRATPPHPKVPSHSRGVLDAPATFERVAIVSRQALELISRCLADDADARPTVRELLADPYFHPSPRQPARICNVSVEKYPTQPPTRSEVRVAVASIPPCRDEGQLERDLDGLEGVTNAREDDPAALRSRFRQAGATYQDVQHRLLGLISGGRTPRELRGLLRHHRLLVPRCAEGTPEAAFASGVLALREELVQLRLFVEGTDDSVRDDGPSNATQGPRASVAPGPGRFSRLFPALMNAVTPQDVDTVVTRRVPIGLSASANAGATFSVNSASELAESCWAECIARCVCARVRNHAERSTTAGGDAKDVHEKRSEADKAVPPSLFDNIFHHLVEWRRSRDAEVRRLRLAPDRDNCLLLALQDLHRTPRLAESLSECICRQLRLHGFHRAKAVTFPRITDARVAQAYLTERPGQPLRPFLVSLQDNIGGNDLPFGVQDMAAHRPRLQRELEAAQFAGDTVTVARLQDEIAALPTTTWHMLVAKRRQLCHPPPPPPGATESNASAAAAAAGNPRYVWVLHDNQRYGRGGELSSFFNEGAAPRSEANSLAATARRHLYDQVQLFVEPSQAELDRHFAPAMGSAKSVSFETIVGGTAIETVVANAPRESVRVRPRVFEFGPVATAATSVGSPTASAELRPVPSPSAPLVAALSGDDSSSRRASDVASIPASAESSALQSLVTHPAHSTTTPPAVAPAARAVSSSPQRAASSAPSGPPLLELLDVDLVFGDDDAEPVPLPLKWQPNLATPTSQLAPCAPVPHYAHWAHALAMVFSTAALQAILPGDVVNAVVGHDSCVAVPASAPGADVSAACSATTAHVSQLVAAPDALPRALYEASVLWRHDHAPFDEAHDDGLPGSGSMAGQHDPLDDAIRPSAAASPAPLATNIRRPATDAAQYAAPRPAFVSRDELAWRDDQRSETVVADLALSRVFQHPSDSQPRDEFAAALAAPLRDWLAGIHHHLQPVLRGWRPRLTQFTQLTALADATKRLMTAQPFLVVVAPSVLHEAVDAAQHRSRGDAHSALRVANEVGAKLADLDALPVRPRDAGAGPWFTFVAWSLCDSQDRLAWELRSSMEPTTVHLLEPTAVTLDRHLSSSLLELWMPEL